jgi:WD domain, G-beta repeat
LFRCAVAEPCISVAASRDGSLIAAGGASGRAYLWDVATGELLRAWQAHFKAISCAVFSDCGSLLVTGGGDGIVHVWDVASVADVEAPTPPAAVTWTGHTMAITAVAFAPGSGLSGGPAAARVISASADRSVRWWDVASQMCLLNVVIPSAATTLCAGPSGQVWYAGALDGCVYTLGGTAPPVPGTIDDGNSKFAFVGHTAAVTAVCITVNGETLVTASDDGSVRVWDTLSCTQLASWAASEGGSGGDSTTTAAAAAAAAAAAPVHANSARAGVTSMLLVNGRPAGLAAGARSAAASAQHLTLATLRKHQTPTPVGFNNVTSRVAIVPLTVHLPDAAVAKEADDALANAWRVLMSIEAATVGGGSVTLDSANEATDNQQQLLKKIAGLEADIVRWKAVAGKLMEGGGKR